MSAFYEIVARYYDAETSAKTDDLIMYSELAEQYGAPILDVGCGTGRVLLHLAQEGYQVHGVDDSKQMLVRLQNKLNAMPHLAENITYDQADILTYRAPQPFSMILLTYNALMHFHTQEVQIQLLQTLRTMLADDGLLVIDLPNAGETFATQDTDSLILDRTFIEPESGHMVMLQSVSYLDRTTQLLRAQWIYDELQPDGTVKRLFVPHVLRYYFYPEMQLLLEKAGFAVEVVYGDTEQGDFEDGCERMVIYARPI
jgi:SAM-dependent methyltransferase